MKDSRICPKCGSTEIIKVPGSEGEHGEGNNIQIDLNNFSSIPVDRYICCSCGYSEEWMDTVYMEKLKKKFG